MSSLSSPDTISSNTRENICEKGYQGLYLGSGAGCWGKNPHNEHGGCFSKVMRIEEKFAIVLPEGLPSEVACPFICGGGTCRHGAVCSLMRTVVAYTSWPRRWMGWNLLTENF